jgi:hypothetical protein
VPFGQRLIFDGSSLDARKTPMVCTLSLPVDMLLNLQIPLRDGTQDKSNRDTLLAELDAGLRGLAKRDDVAAAIAAMGRIEEVWLHSSGW